MADKKNNAPKKKNDAEESIVPLLEVRNITKAFGTLLANDQVNLKINSGEIHALLGENGAGKSTLVKMMYGVLRPTSGEILWEGKPVEINGPAHARELGIGMVFQHFSLFDALNVAENIALALPGDQSLEEVASRVVEVSQAYGLPLEPYRAVYTLSVGERQRIEIVRCLLQNPRLLVMDEP
ncbi:MAG: ATP-binding cassette domain-containing protein, partial [Fimbriimonadaceae bacterium]|nr:ATP-binding cassette domain-containing protein [Alphaproteobacteria bacterium]